MNRILCAVVLAALLLGTIATTVQATPKQDLNLIVAARNGDLLSVKSLIKQGADVNAMFKTLAASMFEGFDPKKPGSADPKNILGMTALMVAAEDGHTDIAKVLIEAGADVNMRTGGRGDGTTALMFAARNGHANIVRLLIEAGADVNAKVGYRDTALSLATEKGHTDVVNILKKAGARS